MRANEVDSLHDVLGGGKVLDGPRSSRRAALAERSTNQAKARPSYKEVEPSDDEDEEEDEEEDADEEEEDDEDAPNDFDELGAEPEGGTDDEDIEMEDAPALSPVTKRGALPKAPKITLKPPAKTDNKTAAKPKLVVTPAKVGPVQSVEDQEMQDDPDDEEVEESSELTDDNEEEDDGDEEDDEEESGEGRTTLAQALGKMTSMNEGAPVDDDEPGAEDDEGSLDDSSDETPGSGSATPDLSKMTKRQRGRPEDQGNLMALDMAPQQRKVWPPTLLFHMNID
jgi:Ino eighty subunit 2